jgi:hypothetical protein
MDRKPIRTCEFCDRQIRTGRKYCWEHRHTSGVGEGYIVDRATKLYFNTQFKKTKIIIFLIFLTSFLISIIITLSDVFDVSTGFLCFFISIIILWLFSIKFFDFKTHKQIKRAIKNKNPEYIEFVEKIVQEKKEEMEFRKSFFK